MFIRYQIHIISIIMFIRYDPRQRVGQRPGANISSNDFLYFIRQYVVTVTKWMY